jgi:hypothetical protein
VEVTHHGRGEYKHRGVIVHSGSRYVSLLLSLSCTREGSPAPGSCQSTCKGLSQTVTKTHTRPQRRCAGPGGCECHGKFYAGWLFDEGRGAAEREVQNKYNNT